MNNNNRKKERKTSRIRWITILRWCYHYHYHYYYHLLSYISNISSNSNRSTFFGDISQQSTIYICMYVYIYVFDILGKYRTNNNDNDILFLIDWWLMIWDGTDLRRVDLPEPTFPTTAINLPRGIYGTNNIEKRRDRDK